MALAGCKLVDQTTFNPPPPPAPAPAAAPAPPPAPALVTIRFDKPDVAYGKALHGAVRAALARKADVSFRVVGVAPSGGAVSADTARLDEVTALARRVAQDILADGVPADHVRLAAQTESGLKAPEVRVFVQ